MNKPNNKKYTQTQSKINLSKFNTMNLSKQTIDKGLFSEEQVKEYKEQPIKKIIKNNRNNRNNPLQQITENNPLKITENKISNNKKTFTSNEISFIKNPSILANSEFPKFKYDGGYGFQTLTITLKGNDNQIQFGGGFFNGFGSSNKSKNTRNTKNNSIDSSIYANGGVMNYMTEDVTLVSVAKNGIFSSFFRSLTDSSFFLSSIVNKGNLPGIVSLASPNPGNIGCFYIPPGKSFNVVSSSYIASTNNLKISSNPKFGGLLTGYGLFYTSVESIDEKPGLVWISSYGELTEHIIEPGHKIKIDNGVILAFDSNVTFTTSLAGKGILSSIFSSEGLVSLIDNQSNSNIIVYLQGRSVKSYNDYIADVAYKVCHNSGSSLFSINIDS